MLTARDNEGNLQEEHSYRPDGKPQESRFADGNWIAYTYGVNGLEKEIHTARSGKEGRAAQEYTYDARGRITGVRDGNRNVTGWRTDAWGRVRRLETAEGGKELYTYDCAGNVTSTTDANGGTIAYRYNSRGKVCEITDQEGNSETFRYDREGRMTSRTDRNGNQVRTAYNVDGNPVMERACSRTGNGEVTRTWEYDGMGNLKKAVAGGFCYTYEYRPDGKLIRKASSGNTLLSCTYNEDKSLRTLTDASGNTVCYGYDSLGRLESIRDETGEEIVRYGHTAGGKLREIRHGNGMDTGYEYDTDGNVTRLTLKNREGEVFSDFEYAYDMNGNRTMKSGGCILPEEESLKGLETRYRYDCMNRLLEEDCGGKAVRYSYDRCGNRTEKLESTGKEVYTYNEKNQLIRRENGASHFAYRYDPQGNVLEECGPLGKMQYRYNALNQQTEVTGGDGRTQENRYDGESLRAAMTENGRLSGFLYYNGELLAETGPEGTVENRYILGYGVAAGRQKGKEGYHSYHQNEQNSTAYILDAEQRIENSYRYDAFGVIRGKKEGIQNRILYTGQQYDQVTGQVYLRARYYNPAVGRFLQEDEYRGDGLNLYAYCRNNPVTYFDPSGYCGSKNCKNDNSGGNSSEGGRVTEGSGDALDDGLGTYRNQGGHHPMAKKAFEGVDEYDANSALTISNDKLDAFGVRHATITGQQNSLYTTYAKTGQPLTIDAMKQIEIQAMTNAGVPIDYATNAVEKATTDLSKLGITKPVKIPWN